MGCPFLFYSFYNIIKVVNNKIKNDFIIRKQCLHIFTQLITGVFRPVLHPDLAARPAVDGAVHSRRAVGAQPRGLQGICQPRDRHCRGLRRAAAGRLAPPAGESQALPRRLPPPLDVFAFFVNADRTGVTLQNLRQLPASELKFVVDTGAAFDEMTWAQKGLQVPLSQLARLYDLVRYRQDRSRAAR